MKKLMVLAVGVAAGMLFAHAADFEINVPDETTETITQALTRMGSSTADLEGNRIIKTGGGTLVGEGGNLFTGITIQDGVFSASVDSDLGKGTGGSDAIYISDGGTLRLDGTSDDYNIFNRMVHLVGSGAQGLGGCVVGKRALPMYGQWILDADAVIASDNADGNPDAGYTKMLELQGSLTPFIRFRGHTLTLRAVNGSTGFLMAWGFWFRIDPADESGEGRMVVDGCTLADRSKTEADFVAVRDERSHVTLTLKNGASFLPSSQAPVSLFAGIDAEPGTNIGTYWDASVQPFGMTIGEFVGAPTFAAKITSLTVTNRFAARVADLKAGHRLTLAGPISFGEGAVAFVEGNLNELGCQDGDRVPLAVSDVSVNGLPALDPTLGNHWTLETGPDGKSIDLVYHYTKPEGSIDISAEWGLHTGSGYAAANSVAFSENLAKLAGQSAKLFLPPGEFFFAEPLAIGAKTGLAFLGEAGDSVIRVTGGGSVFAVSGAQNLTISDLTLAGSAGPAVLAENASGLVVSNNFYREVGGAAEGISEAYPVVAKNCTGTFVLDNYVLDGGVYAAPVLHDGGTSASGGEPVVVNKQSLCRVWVPTGKTEDFFTALAKTGYAAYPVSNRLVKVGGGTLIGTNTLNSAIWGVTVEEGTFEVRADADMGLHDAAVRDIIYVKPGATLLLNAPAITRVIENRLIHLAGSGAYGRYGALESAGLSQVDYAQYYLDDDAVMATTFGLDHTLCLGSRSESSLPSNLDLQGHNLTLRCANANHWGFRLDKQFRFKSGGTLTADGTYFGQASTPIGPTLDAKAVGAVTLRLVNGATFRPRTQGIVSLFANVEADATSQVLGGEASAPDFDMTIGGWKGSGTVSTGIASLTITNSLAFAAADLLSGKAMSAVCLVTAADGVKMRIEDPNGLFAAQGKVSARYPCAVSDVSFTGLPRKDRAGSDFIHWQPVLADGKTLAIDTYLGMTLFLR